jgi:hypothetical protein
MEIKKQILGKFQGIFEFSITPTDKNPIMKDSEKMRHFKVFIKNRATGKEESFIFSQGLGITDTDSETIYLGLVGCFLNDLPYIDLEEFDGLGYEGKEAVKIYKAICDQYDKIKSLGVLEVLENLTEEEKETLQ